MAGLQDATNRDIKEFEKVKSIMLRMATLRKSLCRVNCKPLLHRPACKAMKKDIEDLEGMFNL